MRTLLCDAFPVVAACGFSCSAAFAAVSIIPISAAPDPFSLAYALSADGTTVVGRSVSSGGLDQAFRWSGSLGFDRLGVAPPPSRALGVSTDGSVVVGYTFPPAGGTTQAARWSMGDTTILAPLEGDSGAEAVACSADGAVIVGRSIGLLGWRAARWNAAGIAEPIAPDQSGNPFFNAVGISADAQFIAGNTGLADDSIFRWSASGGFQIIPNNSILGLVARGLSGDGSTIIGAGLFPNSPQTAMRWTESGGFESLGVGSTNAFAVNRDGTIIGGQNGSRAFIWTPEMGAVDLADYLSAVGANTSGWQFWDVTGISADGSAITGYGAFNQDPLTAWVITGIPGPAGSSLFCAGSLFMLRRRRRIS